MTPTPETLRTVAVVLRLHPRHYGETLVVKSNNDAADVLDAAAEAWEEANALLLGAALKYVELQEQLAASEQARQRAESQTTLLRAVLALVPDNIRAEAWSRLDEFEPGGDDAALAQTKA